MDITTPLTLLGGRSPESFVRRHWHKRPLLVRQAVPGIHAPLDRRALFELAGRDDVESRLVQREGASGWSLRHGPFGSRRLPPVGRPGWSLLVQGLDLHLDAAHELLSRFRFLPDARLDDLMMSWASDGGGVGPHVDSYDVFLLQVTGRRRWRIGRTRDASLRPGLPLRILANFEPEQEWLLEPGDMLYLPPQWAHDGVAEGECMTCSIGFRAATRMSIAQELLTALGDELGDEMIAGFGDADADADAEGAPASPDPVLSRRYADPRQPATETPARIPSELQAFATDAVQRLLREPGRLERLLGERLSEPKPGVGFDLPERIADVGRRRPPQGLRLDRRSRMLYDGRCIYLNGESWRAGGADARLMRRLADRRALAPEEVARASAEARALLDEWQDAGWLHEAADASAPDPLPPGGRRSRSRNPG